MNKAFESLAEISAELAENLKGLAKPAPLDRYNPSRAIRALEKALLKGNFNEAQSLALSVASGALSAHEIMAKLDHVNCLNVGLYEEAIHLILGRTSYCCLLRSRGETKSLLDQIEKIKDLPIIFLELRNEILTFEANYALSKKPHLEEKVYGILSNYFETLDTWRHEHHRCPCQVGETHEEKPAEIKDFPKLSEIPVAKLRKLAEANPARALLYPQFETQEDLDFFEPGQRGRSHTDFNQIMTRIFAELGKKAKVAVRPKTVDLAQFFRHLAQTNQKNTPEARAEFLREEGFSTGTQ